MRILNTIFLTTALGLLVGASAQAAIITHVITGVVTSGTHAGTGITSGDPILATLSYDDTQVPVFSSAGRSDYADYSFDIVIGSNSWSESPTSTLIVFNDQSFGDAFFTNGTGSGFAGYNMSDSTGTAFSSTALPTTLSAASFDSDFLVAVAGPNISGSISSISSSSVVPEPGTALLMGLGLVGLSTSGRRTRD